MTNEQIIRKSIEKALENGWDELEMWSPIFSHDFAKAFWGEEKCHCYWDIDSQMISACYNKNCGNIDNLSVDYCYQYHLQMMVLEPDPLQYLAKFLDEPKGTPAIKFYESTQELSENLSDETKDNLL